MKLTKKIEAEIREVYQAYWDSYLSGDLKTMGSFFSDDFTLIGTSDGEVFNNKKSAMKYLKATIDQVAGVLSKKNIDVKISKVDDTILVTEFFDAYVNTDNLPTFYGKFRATSVMKKVRGKWKIIHQHGSLPDSKAEDGETLATEKVKKENSELRDAVKRRTRELEQKNRELEIEASLERLRARAMAMQSSSELADLIALIQTELTRQDVNLMRSFIVLFDASGDSTWWMAGKGFGSLNRGYHMPGSDHPPQKAYFNGWRKRDLVWRYVLKGTVKKRWDNFIFKDTELAELPRTLVSGMRKVKTTFLAASFNKYGCISTGDPIPPTPSAVDLLLRFSRIFEQTYTRFLDLQKAERQTREAQIELSLERVRAKAMAMQSSSELADLIGIIHSEISRLDKNLDRLYIMLFEKSGGSTWWMSDDKNLSLKRGYKLPYHKHPPYLACLLGWRRRKVQWTYLLKGAVKKKWDDFIFKESELAQLPKMIKAHMTGAKVAHWSSSFNKYGCISTGSYAPLEASSFDLMVRFSRMFEQTYTRFLDLQKAEALARESQVQLALERVRARTMAMQHSDELQEAANVLFKQVQSLEIPVWSCGYNIWEKNEKVCTGWMSTNDAKQPPFRIPLTESPTFMRFYKSRKKNEDFYVEKVEGDALVAHYKYMFSLPDFAKIGEAQLKAGLTTLPESQINHVANFAHGNLIFITGESVPDAWDIFKRFAKVFEQTYTRFLDLKRAEAQTLEAQIEAALERVRSRTMAMHRSDELREVVRVLYEQLTQLGFGYGGANIALMDPDSGDMQWWMSGFGLNEFPDSYLVKYFNHPGLDEMLQRWKKGDKFASVQFAGESKKKFDQSFLFESDFRRAPEEVKLQLASLESATFSLAYMKYGALNMGPEAITSEQAEILQRFAIVFEQTYTRFLDLKKAEAQAREAQIEAALEKIRSRSLAMHRSDEVRDVVLILFKKLDELKVVHDTVAIQFFDFKTKDSIFWPGNDLSEEPPKVILPFDKKMMEADTCHRDLWQAMADGEIIFNKVYSKEQKDSWFQYVFANNDLINIPMHAREFMTQANTHTVCFIPGKKSALFADSFDGTCYTEQELDVLKRAARVFEQAYTRFLDLQTAEAQVREAQIEAALEKVRSSSMAMHHSDELEKVVTVLFDKLSELGLSFDGALIYNFDKEKRNLQLWVASKLLSAPVKVNLPYTDEIAKNPIIEDLWRAIENGEHVLNKSYSGKIKDDYFLYVAKNNENNVAQAVRDLQFQSYTISFAAEKNSVVGFDSWTGQLTSDQDFQVIRRFAGVFEQAYTRFLDLQRAEAQARESQIQLALERLRARTMAMHNSSELSEAASLMFEQLSQLGAALWICSFTICDKEKDVVEAWASPPNGKIMDPLYIPVSADTFQQRAYELWKNGGGVLIDHAEGIELQEGGEKLLAHPSMEKARKAVIESGVPIPTWVQQNAITYKHGFLLIVTTQPFEETQIFVRFAKVFEQTYTRFLDLKNAEALARETQIQLALERVRARTMAMQKSDELKEVAMLLFKQVADLGITCWTTGFNVWSEDGNSYVDYVTNPLGGFMEPYTVDTTRFAVIRDVSAARKKGETFYVRLETGDRQKETYSLLTEFGDKDQYGKILESGFQFPSQQVNHFVFGEKVSLLFVTYDHVPEAHDIFKRFGKAFELTFTRFLDLEKAEAQARESQIQLALERVRARTMAMQKSEELNDVAILLFQQASQLGIKTWSTGFNVWSEDNDSYVDYIASPAGNSIDAYKIDATEFSAFVDVANARKSGVEFFISYLDGELLKETYKRLTNFGGEKQYEKMLEDGFQFPSHQYNHFVFGSKVSLMFITYEPVPEAHDIFKRFGKVFEQTYTRFLDLKKAEAQAREAHIEAALEKVRARTMGMQRSDELSETAALMFQQVKSFGFELWNCGFNIWEKDKDECTTWMSTPEGKLIPPSQLPLTEHPIFIKMNETRKDGVDFYVEETGGKGLEEFYQYLKNLPVLGKGLRKFIDEGGQVPTFQIEHVVNFSQGNLIFITYKAYPEAHDIFKRFGKVFEQTYTRFLDLQNAEAQARESQIQLALERVRARTMAMQRSDELAEAAVLMFQQIKSFGLELWGCGFNIWEKDEKECMGWMSSPDGRIVPPVKIPLTEHPVFIEFYESRQKGIEFYTYERGGKELGEFYEYLVTVQEALKEYLDSGGSSPAFQIDHVVNFAHGNLIFITYEPCPDAHDIFKRFGKVFEQTYTRFLDLQNAEAQARESQIQLALERVRARTMAMQRSDELNDLAILLFQQVSQLGIKVWTTGFNDWSEDNNSYIDYITSPQGSLIEAFSIDVTEYPVFVEIANARKSGVEFWVQYLEGEMLKGTHAHLRKSGNKKYEKMVEEGYQFPSHQYNHFVFGSRVSVMFNTYESVPEAHDIFIRFGKVFEQTYTRFLDLKNAEAQAREAQIEAALEKVRSGSLAMHHSDELEKVITVLFDKLLDLGLNIDGAAINIFDKANRSFQVWVASTFLSAPVRVSQPYDEEMANNAIIHDLWRALETGEHVFNRSYSGNTKDDYFRFTARHNESKIPDAIRKFHLEAANWTATWASAPNSIVLLDSWSGKLTSEEDFQVLKRFSRVFDQAYTRFLDLQRAEAQAREAQIEAALERVRSRTMAMHKSEELLEVITVVSEQLQHVGIKFGTVSFGKNSSSFDMDFWVAAPDMKSPIKMYAPYTDIPIYNRLKEAYREGRNYFSDTFTAEETKIWNQHFIDHNPELFSEKSRGYLTSRPGMTRSTVLLKNVFLFLINYDIISYSNEEIEIVIRFANVFEQTYTRFLDLQKAEAQARESQIEAALERLRSRTMAMQRSTELAEVSQLLHQQFLSLGVETITCAFMFPNEEKKTQSGWSVLPDGKLLPQLLDFPLFGDSILDERYRSWKEKMPLHRKVLGVEENRRHHQFLSEQVASHISKDIFTQLPDQLTFTSANFAQGYLMTFTTTQLAAEEENILVRFAKVFEQTYTRFLDLQKAEAQAREAQIEAALEKIRSRSLAMHRSGELKEVVAIMFERLKELNAMLGTIAIQLFDQNSMDSIFWPTNHLQEEICEVKLPYDQRMMDEDTFHKDSWQAKIKGENIINKEYTFEQKTKYFDYVFAHNDSSIIQDASRELITQAKTHIVCLITEKNSALFADNWDGQFFSEENIKVLTRAAKVFDQAYVRFLDLQKAEAQAREAQIEAALERIRSRSLAMHHSGELKDVVAIMFEKMKELNVVIGTIAIQLFDQNTMNSTFWAGNNLHDEPPKVKLPYDKKVMEEDGYMKDCWECKTKGENLINKEYTFEQKTRFFNYVFASNDLATIREADRDVMRQTFVNLPDGHIICLINEKNSSLFADSWYGEFYSDESIKVLIRAAKVFEQAYVRFLDLQKAEAQARESQIEAALERVRARTMAMHKSEELLDVIVVVSQQLTHLDFRFDVVSFARTSEMHDYRYWFCLENAQLAYEMHVPYLNNPMFERVKSAMSQGLKFMADTLTVAENREWIEHMLAHGAWPDITKDVKDFLLSRGYARSIVFMPQIMLFLGNYFLKPYSEEQNNILKRFAAVFEQSYTRFLDLQKAEAQAREGQIEAALERVRSKAMAMHTAEQLSDVVHELRKQMGQLGQKDLETCVIHLNDESPDFVEAWAASRLPSRSDEIQEFHVMIPKRGLKIIEESLEAYSANRKDYVMINDGAKLDEWMEFMRESVPDAYSLLIESINSSSQDIKKRAYWSFADFQGGSMLMVTLAEPNETSRALLRRFSNVFGLAYRRFADLKQAEAQAREATIETALEKIRSRSLGMHKSEEILDVVAILFEKLKELGLVFDGGAAIHLFSEGSRDATIWVMSPELSRPIVSNLPYDEVVAKNPIILDVWKARDTGQHIVNKHYSFDEKKEYFEYVFKHNALVLSNEVKDFIRSANSYTANFIAEKNSLLGASSWTGQVFSENDIEVLKRVAHVFEQAYIRFLDLQRAEVQAKEATIEAALEKIRSRSLGMHHSHELNDVVAILFEKLKELDLPFDGGAGLFLFSEGSRDTSFWVTNGYIPPVCNYLPYDEIDFSDNVIMQDIWKAKDTGEPIVSKHYSCEEKNKLFSYTSKHNDETKIPEAERKRVFEANSYTATFIPERNSLLSVDSWTKQIMSAGDVELLKRVARVFEQAYVRFLDLQRAEAQAREATIEAALEKIRSRSLGMHQSDEIKDVVAIVCEKLKELDLPFDGGAGLYLFPEGSRDIYLWVTNLQMPAPVGVYIPYDENDFSDNSIMQDVWKAKNTGEVIVCKHYSPADKDKLFDYTTKHNVEASLPEEVMRQVAEAESYTATFIPEKNCLLSVDSWTKLMMSAGDIEVLKRVARVFEQAYVRFLDLQKAEVHAKEAVCQASLDRVRAEIASMRTVEDLDRITPLIWRELNTIGIPSIRCGVFIMDEPNHIVHTFLSTPDGKAIGVFHLPFDVPGFVGSIVKHWRDKKVFLDYWDDVAKNNVAETFVKRGLFPSVQQYLNILPKEEFHLHFLPFAQGMLYVGNLTQLKGEELNLLQSLADSFATAYARYDDFNKLESAKQQVDRTLVDLKQAQQQLVQSEKMASLGELTAGIAHEIQNPLNFVNNFSEVSNELIEEMKTELQAGNLKDAAELAESIKQNLEKITHHGKRADGIVKGMLQHSRAGSGQKEPTDLNFLCDEYLRLAYHGYRAKDKSFNAKFETDFDPTLPKVNVVPQDMGRVILNLINNAFYAVSAKASDYAKASSDKSANADGGYEPTVTVSTKRLGDRIEIQVGDNGPGIPASITEKIFQPFFTTKPTGQGTGLGLSLAYDIVTKLHGGELKVETKQGEGCAFVITIPCTK